MSDRRNGDHDRPLRLEVESLLNEPTSDEFLGEPALDVAARLFVVENAPPSMIGRARW